MCRENEAEKICRFLFKKNIYHEIEITYVLEYNYSSVSQVILK